jgi:hypothetical protein
MPRLTRHPYSLAARRHTGHGTYLDLLRVSLDAEFGISSATLALLTKRAECANCHQPAHNFEEHMACGTTTIRGKTKTLLARLFLPGKFVSALQRIDMREGPTRWSVQRQLRVQSAGGSHTREEIKILRRLQEDRCFYCFETLLGPGGGMNGPAEPVTCHKDHFTPLRSGGTNNINNIVLACPRCNSSKCEAPGVEFLLRHMEMARGETRAGLKRIHAARAKHPFRLVPVTD